AIGELLGVEVELRKGGIALDLGLGYRFLSFNNIQYNASGVGITTQTGTLKNISSSPNPSNAMIDFSGLNVTTTLRFF
ncbi:MAG TPA: hypothetical protein VK859_16940, partial [bacterium]|nr:hypothetical protein [bacterium]